MKLICSLTLAVLIAACSSHPVKCRGALRPINATPAGGVGASAGGITATPALTKPARRGRAAKSAATDPQP